MAQEEQLFKATGKLQRTTVVKDLYPLRDHVIVTEMNFEGRKLSSGIMLLGDDGSTAGIRPRWAKVFRIGPEQKEVNIGQWVLVEHGRWTRGLKVEMNGETFIVRRVDPACIIGVQDEEPDYDDNISTAVQAQRKTRD
jgi:Chaperonin 10 Kd subunit